MESQQLKDKRFIPVAAQQLDVAAVPGSGIMAIVTVFDAI
jgi:hypothetical protein